MSDDLGVALELAREVSTADWVVGAVRDFDYTVGSLVPASFEAYGRIFHPAYRDVPAAEGAGQDELQALGTTPDGYPKLYFRREVHWSEVAEANGRLVHPAMDWITITGSWRFLHGDRQPPVWDHEPDEGSLPLRQARRLTSLLARHTTTRDTCWFALWDGYGDIESMRPEAPRVQMPNRPMYLFSGDVNAWLVRQEGDVWGRSPSLWWPQDRAWCVATDVDLMCTYVGGTKACIDELLRDDGLEALEVSSDQDISCEQDTLNPPATDPPSWLTAQPDA